MLHLAIMDALADRIERAPHWDREPVVFLIYVHGRQVTLSPLGVPPYVWGAPGGPAAALELLAAMLAERTSRWSPLRPGRDGSLHGVAFLHEGWEVQAAPDDHHAWRRVQKMAGEGRLREHPGAREVRAVVAVDRDGNTYHARYERGSRAVERGVIFRGAEEEDQAGGVIVEALDRMVEALTGAPPCKRPDATTMTGEVN